MPYALFPMPYALCPIPYALFPIPYDDGKPTDLPAFHSTPETMLVIT